MESHYKSNSNRVLQNAEKLLVKHMSKACLYVADKMKVSISRPNPTGKDPSRPGEPPKKVKGILRGNIDYAVVKQSHKISGFIGVKRSPAERYGLALELGSSGYVSRISKLGKRSVYWRHLDRRPFLRPAVLNNRKRIGRIITTGK